MWCSFSRRFRSVQPLHKAARPGTRDCVSRCSVALHTASHRLAERNRYVALRSLFMSGLDLVDGGSTPVTSPTAPGLPIPLRYIPASAGRTEVRLLRNKPARLSRGRTEGRCLNSTGNASSRTLFCLASAVSRRSPAAAYGLAPYAICVRLQPRLTPSLHQAPNSTGHLMNARFSVGTNFNVITRSKDTAGDIYICILGRSRAAARLLSCVIH